MPATHRDQNYHRHQITRDDAIIPAGEAIDIEARSRPPQATPDAGWLRLRSRDGYLAERAAAAGSVQAVEYMAMRPPSGELYLGDGNTWVNTTIRTFANDTLRAIPFVVPFRLQIDAVVFRVTSASFGHKLQVGLYDTVSDESFPRTLLKALGSGALIAGVHLIAWETTLEPGYYFWCYNTSSDTVSLAHHVAPYMRHVLHTPSTVANSYTNVGYSLPYANGLPATWRENGEVLAYVSTYPVLFGVRRA